MKIKTQIEQAHSHPEDICKTNEVHRTHWVASNMSLEFLPAATLGAVGLGEGKFLCTYIHTCHLGHVGKLSIYGFGGIFGYSNS